MLRQLLTYAHKDRSVAALAQAARAEPQRAFVSASLRPYLLASLIDAESGRPALVVAGDDRAARDLAADLRAFLAPRAVRFYPARGTRYASHLAPPPHLVGLRIAALDALLGGDAAVLVTSAVALAEKVPDPDLRPHGFEIERGGLLDLDGLRHVIEPRHESFRDEKFYGLCRDHDVAIVYGDDDDFPLLDAPRQGRQVLRPLNRRGFAGSARVALIRLS